MLLAATLPAAIVETILASLATLFLAGAGGDLAAARDAAAETLRAYNPATPNELRLAANIISFSFQALDALAQAAAPDLPLTRVLRLRGGAVTLNREATKAERRLAQLQKARNQPIPAQSSATQDPPTQEIPMQDIEPEPAQPSAKVENALALIRDTAAVTMTAKVTNQTWTQSYQQRLRDQRIAARLKKTEARFAATQASAAPACAIPRHDPVSQPVLHPLAV